MSALPEGWEFDYDGQRWFYRYKPNGHIQFSFPREGDEFPQFIDVDAPVPDLAPEEKLESQQQLRRRTSTGNLGGQRPVKGSKNSGRRHVVHGVSELGDVCDGGSRDDSDADGDESHNGEHDSFYYQPENFMFLGPGAYKNVSPMSDDATHSDDDSTVGDAAEEKKEEGVTGRKEEDEDTKSMLTESTSPKVSPLQSETTTPLVVYSEPAQRAQPEQAEATQPEESDTLVSATSPSASSLMLERRHELQASSPYSDPVGRVPEMPSEDTARARIETHPDPVELGDARILAPIETGQASLQGGVAELAERTSPSDRTFPDDISNDLQQTEMPAHLLYQATFGTLARPQGPSSPPPKAMAATSSLPRPGNEDPTQQTETDRSGRAGSPASSASVAATHSHLQRKSTSDDSPSGSVSPVAARKPLRSSASAQAADASRAEDDTPTTPELEISHAVANGQEPGVAECRREADGSLTHAPSILKPARGRAQSQTGETLLLWPSNPLINPRPYLQQDPAVAPARRPIPRASTVPVQLPYPDTPKPQAAYPLTRGFSEPDHVSMPPMPSSPSEPTSQGMGLPRHLSFATSEVSSLGPPSSSQRSKASLRTPSPPDSPWRLSSNASGFSVARRPDGTSSTGQAPASHRSALAELPSAQFVGPRRTNVPGPSPDARSGPQNPDSIQPAMAIPRKPAGPNSFFEDSASSSRRSMYQNTQVSATSTAQFEPKPDTSQTVDGRRRLTEGDSQVPANRRHTMPSDRALDWQNWPSYADQEQADQSNEGHSLKPIQEAPEREHQQSTLDLGPQRVSADGYPPNHFRRAATEVYLMERPGPDTSVTVPVDSNSATVSSPINPRIHWPMMQQIQPDQQHEQAMPGPQGTRQPGMRQKEKEKGGWFSVFKKGSNKLAVLQKKAPVQQPVRLQYATERAAYASPADVGRPDNRPNSQTTLNDQSWRTQAARQNTMLPANSSDSGGRWSIDGQSLANSPQEQTPHNGVSSNQGLDSASSQGPETAGLRADSQLHRQASTASTYASSISTVDIAEAQMQPVMKPNLVSVRYPAGQGQGRGRGYEKERSVTDGAQTSVPASQPQPPIIQIVAPDADDVRTPTVSPAQQPQPQPQHPEDSRTTPDVRRSPHSATGVGFAISSVDSSSSTKQANDDSRDAHALEQQRQAKINRRGSPSRWERPPSTDYSGGDWGE